MAYRTVTASTDLTGAGKGKFLSSWHFAENAGTPAAARVFLRDGGSGGNIVADIRLAASSSASQTYMEKPLLFPSGLYVEVNTGTVRGSVDLL